MNKRFFPIFILLCFLLTAMSVKAQVQMPVTIAPQLIPPYSLQLSSYYQGATPRLLITLINNDFNQPTLRAKLQMTIKGRSTGVQIKTAPTAVTSTYVLQSGIPVQLSLSDLIPLFNANNLIFSGTTIAEYQQRGSLPEDIYDFCFEAFEAVTGERLSQNVCATAYITFLEPPLLNSPQKATEVKITEPTNIVFSWTPRHRPSVATPTEYSFQLVELNHTTTGTYFNKSFINPEAAFSQQRIIYEQKTNLTSLVYGPSHPMLIPGRTYAWRIKADAALPVEDRSMFRNGGYSEIFYFDAVPPCPKVANIVAYSEPGKAMITWQPATGSPMYTISYRKKGSNLPWSTITNFTNYIQLENLEEDAHYEFTISFLCGNYPVTSVLQNVKIAKKTKITGKITWSLYEAAEKNILTGDKYDVISNKPINSTVYSVGEETNSGSKTYSVGNNCIVKLQFFSNDKLIDTLLLRTSASGTYEVEIPKSCYLALSNNANQIKIKASTIIEGHTKIAENESILSNSSLSNHTVNLNLLLNTLELQLSGLYSGTIMGSEKSNVLFDVFMPTDDLNNSLKFWKVANTYNEQILYNGTYYSKVTSKKGSGLIRNLPKLQIPNSNYLVRVTNGANLTYQILSNNINGQNIFSWWKNNTNKRIVVVQNIKLADARQLEGIITYNGVPQKDIKVALIAKKGNNELTKVMNTTAVNGKYSIPFPSVNESGITYEINVRDDFNKLNNINAPNIVLSNLPASGVITKDIDYDFGKNTITGIVLDQNKQPMMGVLVKAFSNGIPYGNLITNENGFYTVVVPGKTEQVELQISADNTISKNVTVKIKGNSKAIDFNTWKSKIQGLSVVKKYINSAQIENPKSIGLEGNNYANGYDFIVGTEYQTLAAFEAQDIELEKTKSYAQFKFVFKAGKGKAKIVFPDNFGTISGTHNEVIQQLVPFRNFKLSIEEINGETVFFPFTINRSFTVSDTGVTVINIDDFVRISGVVKNDDNELLQNAKVYLQGVGSEISTNKKGEFALIIPRNKAYTLNAILDKHESYAQLVQAANNAILNIELKKIRIVIPTVKSFAGHSVSITKIEPDLKAENVFLITGYIAPKNNSVFALSNSSAKLNFEQVRVKVDAAGNAIPETDVTFEETVLNLTAFGHAPVELSDEDGLYMLGMKDANGKVTRAIGGIGSSNTLLKLKANANIKKSELTLSDAEMKNNAAGENDKEIVLVPENYTNTLLSNNSSFSLAFQDMKGDKKFVVGKYIPIYVADEAKFNKNGLELSGSIGTPEVPHLSFLTKKDLFPIKTILFGKNYEFKNLTVDVSKSKPTNLKIQRVRATIESVNVYNLGSSNVSLQMGGFVFTKKPSSTANSDTLYIKNFEFLLQSGKPALTASFRLGKNGISIKGLSFNQSASDELTMSYDSKAKSYKMYATGTLNYKSQNTSNNSKFSTSLFPINIQRFEFGTKDWSFLLIAQANSQINIKTAKITLNRFIVSLGSTNLNKNSLLTILNSTTGDIPEASFGSDEELVEESKANWAVGFKGKLNFESALKGLKANADATMLVSNINNNIEVDMTELNLSIEQSAFTLAAKVKMMVHPNKAGFEGAAKFNVLKNGFDADFKFYKLTDEKTGKEGIEMGATLALNTPIITGPIQWWKIGGGFEFNTLDKMYMVKLLGDLSATGTPKETMYIKNGELKVLFNLAKCDAWPEISAAGTLNMTKKDWVTITAKADFCRSELLVTLKGKVPVAPSINLTVDGVLYALTKSKGAVFLGANAQASALNGMLSGNAFLGFGLNVVSSSLPAVATNLYNMVSNDVKDDKGKKFNGIYINAYYTCKSSGKYGIGSGAISANMSYTFSYTGGINVLYKFKDNKFKLKYAGSLIANGSVSVLSIGVSGKADASFKIEGGYDNKWYVNGNIGLKMELYNKSSLKCNSYSLTSKTCFDFLGVCKSWGIPYPCIKKTCIPYPDPRFKVCFNKTVGFSYTEGKSPSIFIK